MTNANGHNFGDEASPLLVSFAAGANLSILDFNGLHYGSTRLELAARLNRTSVLWGLGSLLQHYFRSQPTVDRRHRTGLPKDAGPDVAWGTGCKDTAETLTQIVRVGGPEAFAPRRSRDRWAAELDVCAVRGPLTAKLLRAAGARVPDQTPCGDPALLLPWLYPRCFRACAPKRRACFVPHFSERRIKGSGAPLAEAARLGVAVPAAAAGPEAVLLFLLDCAFVLSSSLHGVIFAESFGIPARWVRPQSHESLAKYYDYFWCTGRRTPTFAPNVSEALVMGPEGPFSPDADGRALYAAFPRERVRGCTSNAELPQLLAAFAQPIGQRRRCTGEMPP